MPTDPSEAERARRVALVADWLKAEPNKSLDHNKRLLRLNFAKAGISVNWGELKTYIREAKTAVAVVTSRPC